MGILFHNPGAVTLKDLAANVCSLTKGTISLLYGELDLSSVSFVSFIVNKLLKYSGAWLFRHLYVNVSILKWILVLIGNQWSVLKHSVTLSYLSLLSISLAAIFCTHCNLCMSVSGSPTSIALAQSKWDMTKPMTSVLQVSSVKMSHIALSFWRFHIAILHLLAIWILKFNFSSTHAPRYLIHSLPLTTSPLTFISVDTIR